MARMIPPYFSEKCVSPGERALFRRFQTDPRTSNWVVLHSLGVAKHSKRMQGELDFLVLIPGEGILCLEVKAGRVVREEGIWKYGGRNPSESPVGPFQQASDGMHEIRGYISKRDASLKSLMYFSGVFFTGFCFETESPEWHPWQYADRNTLSRIPVSECCLRILRMAHKHVVNTPSAKWYDSKRSRPDETQIKKIVGILRGNFEYPVSPAEKVDLREEEILRFTEEQYSALDLLEENDRIIFKGPAGTGKTLLALEAAKRSVALGHKTLLICFNRLLGIWLINRSNEITGGINSNLKVNSFHSLMLGMSGLDAPDKAGEEFWRKELPEALVSQILESDTELPVWDMIIVDEAQDLLEEPYLDVMELLLDGGLAGGRWAFFGDFERQAIYASGHEDDGLHDLLEILKRRSLFSVTVPLRVNCRNPGEVVDGLELVCNLKPGYSKVLSPGGTEDLVIYYYKDNLGQNNILKDVIGATLKTYLPEDIVVLSYREDMKSCASKVRDEVDVEMAPARLTSERSVLRYSTIHAFKGLESPVVILTDVDRLEGKNAEALLYVGMSRAKHKLVLLLNERCKEVYLNKIQQSYMS